MKYADSKLKEEEVRAKRYLETRQGCNSVSAVCMEKWLRFPCYSMKIWFTYWGLKKKAAILQTAFSRELTHWGRDEMVAIFQMTFDGIFININLWIAIKISPKFVPFSPINNIPALVWIMAWHRSGNEPLSEPMMVSLLTHICIIRPQWVNTKGK